MGFFAPDGKVASFLNAIGNLVALNILTLIFCLPVVTAGAALCALFTMTMRMVRKEDGKIISGYLSAFRINFKKSTIVWVIALLLEAVMALDIFLIWNMTGTVMLVYRILLIVLCVLLAVIVLHFLMLQARFENTIRGTLKNAVVISVARHVISILMLAAMFIPFLLYMVSLRFLSVGFLLGISGPAYIISIYFVAVFRLMEPKTEAVEEEYE